MTLQDLADDIASKNYYKQKEENRIDIMKSANSDTFKFVLPDEEPYPTIECMGSIFEVHAGGSLRDVIIYITRSFGISKFRLFCEERGEIVPSTAPKTLNNGDKFKIIPWDVGYLSKKA